MMSEPKRAEVRLSFLEYRAIFRDPIFEALSGAGDIALALFHAFRPWQVGLENISWRLYPANASEVQISCELLNRKVVFSVGLGSASVFVTDPVWSEADRIRQITSAGMEAVGKSTEAKTETQTLTLAMHVKPLAQSIRSITSGYLRMEHPRSQKGQPRGYGFSVYWDDCSWVVDTSALYPDALFIRIARSFKPEAPLEEVVAGLDSEQAEVLKMLQLELQ